MRALHYTIAGLSVCALLASAAPALASNNPYCGTTGVYSTSGDTGTCTYTTQGTEDTFTVPTGVSALNVTAVGGAGGTGYLPGSSGVGGLGAQVSDTALPVSQDELWVDVGQPGTTATSADSPTSSQCPNYGVGLLGGVPGGLFDGGAGLHDDGSCAGEGGGGGGSSAVLTAPRASATLTGDPATDSRLLVAGAGGGGGAGVSGEDGGNAGDTSVVGAGDGGSATAAYNGGYDATAGGVGPTDGSDGGGVGIEDANGGTASTGGYAVYGGGGGGGGWFGGGGGGGGAGGGGGGGSSYGGAGPSNDITTSTASSSQQPEVVISWPLTVTPSLSTQVDDASTGAGWLGYEIPGAKAQDTATLTGLLSGEVPTGSVTYSLHANPTCSGTATSTQTVPLNADGTVPDSADTAKLTAGSYSYQASYSGAGIYNPTTGSCEPFTVVPDQADVSVSITGPSSAADNGSFNEIVTVKNNGPAPATNVVTALILPGGVTVKSADSGSDLLGSLVWSAKSILPGDSDTYTVTLTVGARTRETAFISAAAASLTVPDPDYANNAAESTITLGSSTSSGGTVHADVERRSHNPLALGRRLVSHLRRLDRRHQR